jgi:hypothetical protein
LSIELFSDFASSWRIWVSIPTGSLNIQFILEVFMAPIIKYKNQRHWESKANYFEVQNLKTLASFRTKAQPRAVINQKSEVKRRRMSLPCPG